MSQQFIRDNKAVCVICGLSIPFRPHVDGDYEKSKEQIDSHFEKEHPDFTDAKSAAVARPEDRP